MKVLSDRFVLAADAPPRKGGMAEVCRAADVKDGLRPVAVKFVSASRLHDDRIVREAFTRELSALHALDHPNIVRMVDFDPRHEPPFMVLEWLERDLLTYLSGSLLDGWDDFFERVGRPVLSALAYALTKRVVHRDLKPGNILVDEHGAPKVTDFGISRFQDQGAGGLTLAAFKSEPYAPFDDLPSSESRDPYSFAVLALRCLATTEFTSHEDVAKALQAFAGPPAILAVLRRALSVNPSERYANVVELQAALEQAHAACHPREPKETRVCYVVPVGPAIGQLTRQLGLNDENRTRRLLEQDLSEACALFPWIDKQSGKKSDRQLLARTPQFRLRLEVSDRSGDHLLLRNAWLDDSEKHEVHSEFGFHPNAVFRLDRPPPGSDATPVIEWLLEAVRQHDLESAEARRARNEEEVLREWANTLRFRQHLDERRHAPISYDGYHIDGSRVVFRVSAMPEGVTVDQPRLIRRDQRIVLSGLVDDVRGDGVVLWIEGGIGDAPPDKGQLLLDDRAARVAIDRQKGALDAVRYSRCLRPALRTLIIDPTKAQPPSLVTDVKWIQSAFDDDKKQAVAKALGTDDVLVVHGPPGTGKTVFITELVAQLLEREPACKILLTSQTHVALDNALERLHQLRPTARLLRVAQRDDDRVSAKVRNLTIDRVAERWRGEVGRASERFLTSIAAELGVRRDDIRLGIAVGRLRAESAELDRIEARLQECEAMLAEAERGFAAAEAERVADRYHETTEALDELRDQTKELRELRKTIGARRREAQRELTQLGDVGAQLSVADTAELAEWEEGLLAASDADRKFHSLIRLAEQWQLRFSRSREFYAAMVADSSVVAGTCLGFARVPGMLTAEFDVCIVDEASKATATELLVPLSRSRRWILVGDPKQLPPFVEDLLDDADLLKNYSLDRESFQTTLLDRLVSALPESNVASLRTQHRMIRPIGNLISECFYEGVLNSVRDENHDRLRLVMPAPITWLTTAKLPQHDETEFRGTFKNLCEARVIRQFLKRLDFVARTTTATYRVGVISGYVGQCTELQRLVAELQREVSALSVECNTVDAFQGREVDICVYSVTRCNSRGRIGFLRDARRMNVALSRGRSGLVIVGDHLFCRAAGVPNPLRTVVEYVENHSDSCAIAEATHEAR